MIITFKVQAPLMDSHSNAMHKELIKNRCLLKGSILNEYLRYRAVKSQLASWNATIKPNRGHHKYGVDLVFELKLVSSFNSVENLGVLEINSINGIKQRDLKCWKTV